MNNWYWIFLMIIQVLSILLLLLTWPWISLPIQVWIIDLKATVLSEIIVHPNSMSMDKIIILIYTIAWLPPVGKCA